MSLCRYLSTAVRSSATPVFSEVVKQFSKFSSHDKLLDYSQRPISHCYPNQMIDACSTPVDLIRTASDLHEQLLVRVAHCINYFQSLPFLPAANPTLLSVHERYLKFFENLAQFPKIENDVDEEKFFNLINLCTQQSQDTIGRLSTGCCDARKYFKTYEIMRNFLDNVLRIRLSMRLLTEHYTELHKQLKRNKPNNEWQGAIQMKFSPANAVQQCVDDVSTVCFETYSVVPQIQIEDNFRGTLPYFPSIVEYILRELIKNSFRAIVESHYVMFGNMHNVKQYFQENQDEPLCKVLITTDPDDEHFLIAIQDRGGGIEETDEKLFQYMYSGDVGRNNEDEETDPLSMFQETMIKSKKQMFGYGFGLPICRLYAQFFNGSLTLRQVSRIGTDVYLRLGFIHTNSELKSVLNKMTTLQRKLGRRYQRYLSARQTIEEKDDEPKDIWQRIIQMSDVLSAIAIDLQTNDIFPLYGLNNIARTDLNNYAREYIEMAKDFVLNMDPTDELKILRIRSEEREIVIAYDDGTVFVIIQLLSKDKNVLSPALSFEL